VLGSLQPKNNKMSRLGHIGANVFITLVPI